MEININKSWYENINQESLIITVDNQEYFCHFTNLRSQLINYAYSMKINTEQAQ